MNKNTKIIIAMLSVAIVVVAAALVFLWRPWDTKVEPEPTVTAEPSPTKITNFDPGERPFLELFEDHETPDSIAKFALDDDNRIVFSGGEYGSAFEHPEGFHPLADDCSLMNPEDLCPAAVSSDGKFMILVSSDTASTRLLETPEEFVEVRHDTGVAAVVLVDIDSESTTHVGVLSRTGNEGIIVIPNGVDVTEQEIMDFLNDVTIVVEG